MASQGGKLTFTPITDKKKHKCTCGNKALYHITCSSNFFELRIREVCEDCLTKCKECTAQNVSIKSALDD